jgi:hypothetical protein
MAWYALIRKSDTGLVDGFIEDDATGAPMHWPTEHEAEQAVSGHILEPVIEIIEL